jgi:hypothetical protein
MPQQVDDSRLAAMGRAQELGEQALITRPDAFERPRLGEEAVQNLWPQPASGDLSRRIIGVLFRLHFEQIWAETRDR